MGTKSSTNEEFKKILKKLFENKEEGLDEGTHREHFYAKIEKLQNLALEEEMVQIKEAWEASKEQNQQLLQQVEKGKTMVAKLHQECAEYQERVRQLEEEKRHIEKEWQGLQESGHLQVEKWQQEKGLLEKKYGKMQQQMSEFLEEREMVQENYEKLEKAFKQNQRHFREESEAHFAEVSRLQERCLAAENQLKETDLAKVHEDYEEKLGKWKLWAEEARAELDHVKQSALLTLENKEKNLQALGEKCQQMEEELGILKRALEERESESVAFQKKGQEFLYKWEESEGELHRAQLHLAKKVKESALLQDVAQKQKEQIIEAQREWSKENELRVALEKSVDGFLQKEDQLTAYIQQCRQEAADVIEGLETQCRRLEEQIEKQAGKIVELEKYKEGYEKLLSTLKELNPSRKN